MKNNSPEEIMIAVSHSTQERTGKTLEEGVQQVLHSGLNPPDQYAVRKWLKSEHGVLQNSQWSIADVAARAAGWVPPTVEEYVGQQFSGPKDALRPIFDFYAQFCESFGPDIIIEGRSNYTLFVRTRQFVAFQAVTKDRVDIGLHFNQPPDSSLLKSSDNPGQATHKLSLKSSAEIDAQVIEILRQAYEQNG